MVRLLPQSTFLLAYWWLLSALEAMRIIQVEIIGFTFLAPSVAVIWRGLRGGLGIRLRISWK